MRMGHRLQAMLVSLQAFPKSARSTPTLQHPDFFRDALLPQSLRAQPSLSREPRGHQQPSGLPLRCHPACAIFQHDPHSGTKFCCSPRLLISDHGPMLTQMLEAHPEAGELSLHLVLPESSCQEILLSRTPEGASPPPPTHTSPFAPTLVRAILLPGQLVSCPCL